MVEALLVLFVLGFGLAFTVGLYLLIESETSNPRVIDRQTAEREAKEQGGLRENRTRRQTETDRLERDRGRHPDTGPESSESERATETDTTGDDYSFDWDDR